MSSDEAQLRQSVLTKLAPLHAVPIESPMEAGVPDVNCVVGWLELKHLNEWPVREDTVVRPHHFRPVQRNWLRTRCLHGGAAWLLLRVGDPLVGSWHLVWGVSAATHVGTDWTRADLSRNTSEQMWWSRQPQSGDLVAALTRRSWLPSQA